MKERLEGTIHASGLPSKENAGSPPEIPVEPISKPREVGPDLSIDLRGRPGEVMERLDKLQDELKRDAPHKEGEFLDASDDITEEDERELEETIAAHDQYMDDRRRDMMFEDAGIFLARAEMAGYTADEMRGLTDLELQKILVAWPKLTKEEVLDMVRANMNDELQKLKDNAKKRGERPEDDDSRQDAQEPTDTKIDAPPEQP